MTVDFVYLIHFLSLKEIDEQNETEDETSNSIDSSVSEDEDDSVCSIVMSTSDENNNSLSLDTSDLMKNYAIMLEVPTTLTTSNDQI
jgi:methanogen extracellular protein (TIGR04279 family)